MDGAPRPDEARPHAGPRTHRAPLSEAPKAPWSPFPLVELRRAFQARTGGIGFRV